MTDQDYLYTGIMVTLFLIVVNLLVFVAVPMSPILVKKIKEALAQKKELNENSSNS